MPTALQSTSIGWLLLSLGHTLGAKNWQSSPQFRTLPRADSGCARVGWYQGSVFFIVNALLNYNWSLAPEQLRNPINRAIAVILTAVMWGSSGWYFKHGVAPNGVVVALMGALQAYAGLRE
ncbi:hypothetical protein BJY04DRAFT_218996 [Aspergillus karnatakaensis]|uniref:uncharacterized protein n=1 Tax=Aspergillus karnatakaensis TaxID=1810916 RepID=UPI003CCCFB36